MKLWLIRKDRVLVACVCLWTCNSGFQFHLQHWVSQVYCRGIHTKVVHNRFTGFLLGLMEQPKQGSFHVWLLFFKLGRVSIYTADNIVTTPLSIINLLVNAITCSLMFHFQNTLGKIFFSSSFLVSPPATSSLKVLLKYILIHYITFLTIVFLSFLCGCAGDDIYHLFSPTSPHVLHM